jgi:predicted phosphodiesterase
VSYPLTAIVADLHGNRPALETALLDAKERGVRRFVCLGDVVGYGAEPRHNLDLVMQLCVAEPDGGALGYAPGELAGGLCLQGNHEHALLHSAEDFNPKARAAIEWTREELNRGDSRETNYDYWDFIGGLEPLERDDVAMFAHGSPRGPVREYLLPRDIQDEAKMRANFAVMAAADRAVCFVGHSHVPAVYYADQRLYRPRDTEGPYDLGQVACIVNVGSVGQPRDGDPRLSYALFDGRNISFVRLEYDFAAAQAKIRAVAALPDYLADRLAVGR